MSTNTNKKTNPINKTGKFKKLNCHPKHKTKKYT